MLGILFQIISTSSTELITEICARTEIQCRDSRNLLNSSNISYIKGTWYNCISIRTGIHFRLRLLIQTFEMCLMFLFVIPLVRHFTMRKCLLYMARSSINNVLIANKWKEKEIRRYVVYHDSYIVRSITDWCWGKLLAEVNQWVKHSR